VAPGATATSSLTFDAAGQAPGCKEAQLVILNDTPYGSLVRPAGITVEFGDVPAGSFGDAFIHGIAGARVTAGCGGGNFCPNDVMTRRVMAVWLLLAKFGPAYNPPPASGIFGDVSPESFGANFIEDLFNRGIVTGCSTNPPLYCPESPVTRAQMAVFLLATLEGPGYQPPPCQGMFGDMPCTSPFAKWVEELARRGITGGCSTTPPLYCPDSSTTRAQMAIFTSATFDIAACRQ
jgi:hypothetical protein